MIFSEKEITLRLLLSVEAAIVQIETFVDEQITFVTNFSTNFSMPMFKLLLTNSALMVQGGSIEQLQQLEAICDEYIERIRVAKGKPAKKCLRTLSDIRIPSPDDDILSCTAGIMIRKVGDKITYAQCELRYNQNTKEIEWKGKGDTNYTKDRFRKAKTINTTERVLEIEMLVNKKVVQFPDSNTFMQWSSKLLVNLTRTMTHK